MKTILLYVFGLSLAYVVATSVVAQFEAATMSVSTAIRKG